MPSASTTAAPGMSATTGMPATTARMAAASAPAPASTPTHAPASTTRASTAAVASTGSIRRCGLTATAAPPVVAPIGLASHRCRSVRGPIVTISHRPIASLERAFAIEPATPSHATVTHRPFTGPAHLRRLG